MPSRDLSQRMKRNAPLILALNKASSSVRKAAIRSGAKDFILALVEIAKNLITRKVNLSDAHLQSLRRHKQQIQQLVKAKTSLTRRREILQTGGFLATLIQPVLGLLGGLLGGLGGGGGNRVRT